MAATMTAMADAGIKPRFMSLRLHPRNLFLPATVALVLLLRWKLALPLWGLGLILLVLPVYYFVLPQMVRRALWAFERDVLRLLQQGKRTELLGAYRKRWLLRLLAPPEKLQRQLAFIYNEVGDYSRACACYERAAKAAAPADRPGVLLGLANARYRAGDYEGAEVVYRELVRRGQRMPEVLAGLAHALLLRGRDLGEALRLARRAVSSVAAGPSATAARLTLAEALLARGRPGKARTELGEAVVSPSDRWLTARRRWVEALLARNDGDEEATRELLAEVVDLDGKGGLGDLARRQLSELEGERERDGSRVAG